MAGNPLTAGLRPVHPGEILREDVLPALGKPKTEVAELLKVSRQSLYDILNEKRPVTPQMALRIGKLCGNGPDLWLRMQQAFDLAHARTDIAEELAAIPTLKEPMAA